jgi:hypothetical protein
MRDCAERTGSRSPAADSALRPRAMTYICPFLLDALVPSGAPLSIVVILWRSIRSRLRACDLEPFSFVLFAGG